ncbi:MAG: hypothetical protein WAU90_13435 [Methyloceanibacter sp.]
MMARLLIPAAVGRISAIVLAPLMVVACAITPRTGRPADIWLSKGGLQQTVNCVLGQLDDSMAKGRPPNFTNSVRIVTPGKVEEIVPQQIAGGSGELYVVRFVANDDGNIEVTVFSTLDGLDKRVQKAIDPCKKSDLAAKPAAQ